MKFELYNFRQATTAEQQIPSDLIEEPFLSVSSNIQEEKQAVEDRAGQEYLLPDGTPIYKFFKRNPYGG